MRNFKKLKFLINWILIWLNLNFIWILIWLNFNVISIWILLFQFDWIFYWIWFLLNFHLIRFLMNSIPIWSNSNEITEWGECAAQVRTSEAEAALR